jgi:hypothetical protein
MWMLCVVLSLSNDRTCWPVPTEALCHLEMQKWADRSESWSSRSGIPPRFLSVCFPPGWETGRELTARERPPR